MKHIKLFEKFNSIVYHYTTNNNLLSILKDGYIKGHAGSVYDEEDGETISLTSDDKYHTKGHDISIDCRIQLNRNDIEKRYKVFDVEDYGYNEIRIQELIKQGIDKETAEEIANEHQCVIKTDKLPISYINTIHFIKKPSQNLIQEMDNNSIAWGY